MVVGGTVRGDRRAIGCIAIVLAPSRMAEARDELGEHYADDDGDVLQEFFLVLCEAGLTFPAIRGAGEAWLGKMARQVAREHLSKRRQFPREAG